MLLNKRKLFLSLAIISTLAVGLPYLAGQLVKREIGKMITVFSEQNGPYTLEQVEYREGWFTSYMKTRVDIKINDSTVQTILNDNQFKVFVEHDIHHNPLTLMHLNLADIRSHLVLSADLQASLDKIIDQQQVLSLRSQIGLLGNFHFEAKVKPFKFDLENIFFLACKGSTFSLDLNSKMDHYHYVMNFSGGEIVGGDKITKPLEVILGEIKHVDERSRSQSRLWLGKNNIFIDHLKVFIDSKEKLSFKTFKSNGSCFEENKLIQIKTDSTIEKITWHQKESGPWKIDWVLNRISSEAVKSLADNLNQQYITGNEEPYLTNIREKDIPAILGMRPEMHLNSILNTPQGDVKCELDLAIGGEKVTNPKAWGDLINTGFARMDITLPQLWVKELMFAHYKNQYMDLMIARTPEHDQNKLKESFETMSWDSLHKTVDTDLENLALQGILQSKDNTYIIKLGYKDNHITLNGNAIPFRG